MSVISRDISLDTYTSNKAVGSSSGGCDYSLLGNRDKPVQEITWYPTSDNGIGRVMMRKCDGTCITIGSLPSSQALPEVTWTFKPDELFDSIELFSLNDRLAGACVRTRAPYKQELKVGYVQGEPQKIPSGTGLCVGIFGNFSRCVDNLGFAMRRN